MPTKWPEGYTLDPDGFTVSRNGSMMRDYRRGKMGAEDTKARVLELIKEYLQRPDVQQSELTLQVLNCLAGDIQVIEVCDAE